MTKDNTPNTPEYTTEVMNPSTTPPMSGDDTFTGSYPPPLGRPFYLTLTGTWTGSVQVLRNGLPMTAGGAPYGSYTANCNEAITVETQAGITYSLKIVLSTGHVHWNLAS